MARKRKRKAFETLEPSQPVRRPESSARDGSIFSFFRDHGIRETIESIIVAVVLALMFRAYETEAFIIPTGSMAPTLQGQHMDVNCDQCGFQYRSGASYSGSSTPPSDRGLITKTYCPICRYGMKMRPDSEANHRSFNGDRILVNKFVYDFQPPERFDVIVFKNPNNGKQNYIKRLVGLPGDNLLLENGDVFNMVATADGKHEKQIIRKPADKVQVMLQTVDDTNHIATQFRRIADWPSRWQQWDNPNTDWKILESKNKPYFVNEGASSDLSWLRYRHLAPRSAMDEDAYAQQRLGKPRETEWEQIEKGKVPRRIMNNGKVAAGALIRDYYEYNDRHYQFPPNRGRVPAKQQFWSMAAHWVGDLAMECDVVIESDSGTIAFDLVEGGVHFQCKIDIETGKATLETLGEDSHIVFDCPAGSPTAQTPINGHGTYKITYAQLDDMVYLFVNGRNVEFNGSSYKNTSGKRLQPKYSPEDPGDAEPLGIASANANIRVNRLKVLRDIYYVSPKNFLDPDISNEIDYVPDRVRVSVYEKPNEWGQGVAKNIFQRATLTRPMYELGPGQYFPMGDNSPASQDARIWDGTKSVDEKMLIGRAMFIYWPHSLNKPVKFFPNFGRMGFIR